MLFFKLLPTWVLRFECFVLFLARAKKSARTADDKANVRIIRIISPHQPVYNAYLVPLICYNSTVGITLFSIN